MRLAIRQRSAYADDEDGSIALGSFILTLLRSEIGIEVEELLGVDERDFFRKPGCDMGEALIDISLHRLQGAVDLADRILEIVEGSVFFTYGLFPVPLVYVEGMEVVEILKRADGVHVGVEAIAGRYVVGSEFHPFPFCEGMHHFGAPAIESLYGEAYRVFHAVKVVVDAGA